MENLKLVDAVCTQLEDISTKALVNKFFEIQIQEFDRGLVMLEANLKSMKILHTTQLASTEYDIEDAEKALTQSYLHVDLDRIGTNADAKKYMSAYWASVNAAKDSLKALKLAKKEAIATYEQEVKEVEENIKNHKERILIIKSWK